MEKAESIESSRLSTVQEAPSPTDDDDDGFFVAAPHIVNSPPKLSPIPLIEGTSIYLALILLFIDRRDSMFSAFRIAVADCVIPIEYNSE